MPAPTIAAGTPGYQASNTSGTSVAVPMPSGVLVGDVLIASVTWVGPAVDVMTDPTGDWSPILTSRSSSGSQKIATFKRIADGTEDASYTFTYPGPSRATGVILRCIGGSDVDVSAGLSGAGGTTATFPTVTTTGPDRALILLASRASGGNLTPPAGASLLIAPTTTSHRQDVVVASQAVAGASSFGTGTWDSYTENATQTIAVSPSSDVTPPPVPTGLMVTGTTDRSVSLSWSPVSAPDLAAYRVYRGATLVSTQTGTSVTVGDIAASTAHSWQVSSVDQIGNESALSSAVTGATTAAGPPPAGIASPGTIIEPVLGAPFITLGEPGTWNAYQNREHGNAVLDLDDPDANRRYKFSWSGMAAADLRPKIGMAFSGDGLTWTMHPGNPVSGAGAGPSEAGEDPYIAKNISDGSAYRDSSGRLLMFSEEKPSGAGGQLGVQMHRSSDNGLTWINFGQVLGPNPTAGQWDSSDRTSPAVFHDGTRMVMIFEGRNQSGVGVENKGMIGVAYSTDEGVTWTVGNGGDPIIDTSVNVAAWGQGGVVSDDIILIAGAYYMTVHGQAVGAGGSSAFNNAGRWKCFNLDPSTWTEADWVEIAGNPYNTDTSTQMFIGNDGGRIVTERDRINLYVTTLEAATVPFIGWGVPL